VICFVIPSVLVLASDMFIQWGSVRLFELCCVFVNTVPVHEMR
jgi:hypothetical protein